LLATLGITPALARHQRTKRTHRDQVHDERDSAILMRATGKIGESWVTNNAGTKSIIAMIVSLIHRRSLQDLSASIVAAPVTLTFIKAAFQLDLHIFNQWRPPHGRSVS
jgi:hypothetical protein